MIIDNLENIIMLLCTITGLLYCIFKYIEIPKRGYRLLIVFFLAKFLSEYYWTIYMLITRDDPDVSEFAAYLGWNVGYLFLLITVFFVRQSGAKRYFHPVILLPVLLNIPQFILYIQYGAVLNNIWQVGVTTLTAVFCLQELMYWLKNRKKQKAFPLFSLLVILYLVMEYAMWTSSCFDWPGAAQSPYLYCSIVSSLLTVFFGYGVRKYYDSEGAEADAKNETAQRFHVLLQTSVALVILFICAAGYFVASRIETGNIILVLFIISAVLILLVLILIFVLTSRYRRFLNSNKMVNEAKRSRVNFIFTVAITLVLMALAVFYNSVNLYRSSVVSVYEDGDERVTSMATELENYLTVAMTTLRVAADSVDLMEKKGDSTADIKQYIVDQTSIQAQQFDENFTGIYAYVNGEYLDGLNWEPPSGYEPTERNWYKAAVKGNGEIVIVSPYQDAQTGSIVITIGKCISDSAKTAAKKEHNVVCLDVIVNYIQYVTESVEIAEKGYGMVVNSDGFIVAHKDPSLNGENAAEVYSHDLLNSIVNPKEGRATAVIDGENNTLFVSPVMDQWYAAIVISNSELLEDTYSQLAINILVSFIIFCLVAFFFYMGYKNERMYGRKVEAMNVHVVSALASAIDAKDTYTNGHSSRVAEYARMIAERAGYSKTEQDEIYLMGLLHDVGKIGVPDEVINKPSKLTDEEFELVKKHPEIGAGILESIKERPELATGARWHHERYGGGGYPDGISGEEIPEEARIIAVADAYDAMTSRRSYRDVMTQEKVRSEVEKGAGTQFDPRFARIMREMIDEDTEYTMREK